MFVQTITEKNVYSMYSSYCSLCLGPCDIIQANQKIQLHIHFTLRVAPSAQDLHLSLAHCVPWGQDSATYYFLLINQSITPGQGSDEKIIPPLSRFTYCMEKRNSGFTLNWDKVRMHVARCPSPFVRGEG